MMGREVEISVNIAKARDSLQWFGGLYTVFVGAVSLRLLARKPVPGIAAVPAVIGGFGLAYLADLAYGTKMTRVVKEAEHILEHERVRFVPPKQAPFHALYSEQEVSDATQRADAVGTYWPSFVPVARSR